MKLRRIIGFVLAVILLTIPLANIPTATVSAAQIETIGDGQSWRQQWTASQEENYLYIRVQETGFYNITVADYKKTAGVNGDLWKGDESHVAGFWVSSDKGYSESKTVYLTGGTNYELILEYFNCDSEHDDYIYQSADVGVTVNRSNYNPEVIPTGALSSSTLLATMDIGWDFYWFEYVADSTGDYRLNFSSIEATVECYDAYTGVKIGATMYTSYWDDSDYEEFYYNGAMFQLEAGKKYYFSFRVYGMGNTKLSMTKCKGIKSIDLVQGSYTLYWDFYIDKTEFSYRIIYEDSTSEMLTWEELSKRGYGSIYIDYCGETYFDEYYQYYSFKSGKQPVIVSLEYSDEEYLNYVTVTSMTEWCSTRSPISEWQSINIAHKYGKQSR